MASDSEPGNVFTRPQTSPSHSLVKEHQTRWKRE